jgi:hypothetical protein
MRRPARHAILALSLAALVLCFASGCATVRVIGKATERGPDRFDDIVSIEGAWASDFELIVAFRVHLGRSARNYYDYSPPGLLEFARRRWFRVSLSRFSADDSSDWRDSPGTCDSLPARLARTFVRRDALRSGSPSEAELRGFSPVQFFNPHGPERSSDENAEGRGVNSPRVNAIFLLRPGSGRRQNWEVGAAIAVSLRDAPGESVRRHTLRLCPEHGSVNPLWWVLLPPALAADIICVPFQIVRAFFAPVGFHGPAENLFLPYPWEDY